MSDSTLNGQAIPASLDQNTTGQFVSNDDSTQSNLLTLSGLEQKDRIQILLSEYSTLRAEIISRTGYGFQLTSIGIGLVTYALKEMSANSPWYFWLGVAVLVAVFVLGIFVNNRDLKRAAHRVKALEHEINSRAGEHLLIWETLSGVATRKGMGIERSFFCNVKPLPRSALPPLQASFLVRDAEHHACDLQSDSKSIKEQFRDGTYGNKEKLLLLCSAKFWTIIAVGAAFAVIQGICAYFDGYFTQAQIGKVHEISNAYAFIEHGGMWSDFFIVTPIVAYIISGYRLPYISVPGFLLFVVTLIVCIAAGNMYQDMGKILPEAHTHFGHTPLAGWIHGLYAIAAIWICAMFYLTHVEPQPAYDMIAISIGLTIHTVLGVIKFNPNWSWSTEAIIQVAVFIALIWVMTAYRFGRYKEKVHRVGIIGI